MSATSAYGNTGSHPRCVPMRVPTSSARMNVTSPKTRRAPRGRKRSAQAAAAAAAAAR